MGKVIKLTESSFKRLLEYTGEVEELGRYDIDDDLYNMSDEEYNDLKQQQGEWNDQYEIDMKDMADDWEADQFIGRDYYDPSDNDLYSGRY